ncbi:MAG: zinc ribbon domain-containing protein [Promethearchaeota archaeon]
MKYKFWILVIITGGILMIIGSATGSAFYTWLLQKLIDTGIIGVEFIPLLTSLMVVLEYITYYGGYSVLVAVFFILIKWNRLGRIIITIATGFGLLGLIVFVVTWAVGYFGITLEPLWAGILAQIYSFFSFNSGLAFAGTALAVVGKFGLKRAEKADKKEEKEEEKEESSSDNPGTKFCPECGASLPARANFCNKCGKNFD